MRPSDRETRERVLHAAQQLFSRRGFKDVTVREICLAAQANVAAVNYHFGDKVGLYRQVMQIAIDAMRDATDAARQAGVGKSPDEQLRVYIAIFLQRLLVVPGHDSVHQLVTREINDPTPALDDLVEQGIRPRIEYLSGVIAAMIGCEPSDRRVMRCLASVQSQSLIYARPNAVSERLGFSHPLTPEDIEEIARHIADFSIAGVHAVGRAR